MNQIRAFIELFKQFLSNRSRAMETWRWNTYLFRSLGFGHEFEDRPVESSQTSRTAENPLTDFFNARTEGRGIWKCEHYFDIYHRHFERFRGNSPTILEIGIYSGGSLDMWREYFGNDCHIHGVDIQPDCKEYESENITVHIGDQEDRAFWSRFNQDVSGIDILIDDGGHSAEQQIVTLEEMLPRLNSGGVYLCEDVVGSNNRFASYAAGLVSSLNQFNYEEGEPLRSFTNSFQKGVYSIHFYPLVVVIEKHSDSPEQIVAPKHGTMWQPFFD